MSDYTIWISNNLTLIAAAFAAVLALGLLALPIALLLYRRNRVSNDRQRQEQTLTAPTPPLGIGSQRTGLQTPDVGARTEVAHIAPTGTPDTTQEPPATHAEAGRRASSPQPSHSSLPPRSDDEPSNLDETLVLHPKPRVRHLGLLINRTDPAERYDIAADSVSIGRASGNDIVVSSSAVSRQHAMIRWVGDRYVISDLESANGTYVDDERARSPTPLRDGARIRFGDTEFVFKVVMLD